MAACATRSAAAPLATKTALLALTSEDDDLLTSPIVVLGSLTLIGSFFWLPVGLVWFYRKKCTTRKRKAAFWVAVALLLLTPVPINRRLTRWFLWERFRRYLRVRIQVDPRAAALKQALFALSPHGVFPFGIALASLTELNEKPFLEARPVVARGIYRFPVIGHILARIGAVAASPAAVDAALRSGLSLALAPGGIAEIFLGWPRPGADPNKEYVLLKERKGFVRRALENGVPLVPVYVFGISETFSRAPLPAVAETLSRLLKTSLVLFWGRWGLPVPFRVPLLLAVGEPVAPEPGRAPGPAQKAEVDLMHRRFVEALRRVFERHKGDYGWGGKELEIV